MRAPNTASRCVLVMALTALPVCTSAVAPAESPPPIDHSRLPQPAPPSPSRPTVQREICAVPSVDPKADNAQLSGRELQQVWKLSRGSGQRVAIIDTGVTPHPRLKRVVAGGDYVSTGDGTQDCDGHGTAVAGIIAATTESDPAGFGGVAPDADLISIRQSSMKFGTAAEPANPGVGDVDTMARAVRTAADLGASVINISTLACTDTASALDDRALGAALSYAVDTKDVVVVAAAGNTGTGQCPNRPAAPAGNTPNLIVSPAWYDDYVLTVGSVNVGGEPSAFTLAGPWVDVAAPGEGVVSLNSTGSGLANVIDGQQGSLPLSGTSYATPVVSGLAALIRSRFPMWTARQVMTRIKASAHHPPGGWDPRVGAGPVDLLEAVSTDTPTGPAPPPARVPKRVVESAHPASTGRRARRTAFAGTAGCGAVVVAVLSAGVLRTRRRSPNSDNVLRD